MTQLKWALGAAAILTYAVPGAAQVRGQATGQSTGQGARAGQPQGASQAARMSQAEARLLYAAGGFPISGDDKGPTNRCRASAAPVISFVDMNGDERREALFVDRGPCYQPDGHWYAVAAQDASGRWRPILEGPGTVRTAGTRANGWFVLNATGGGKTETLIFDGQRYVTQPRAGATVTAPSTQRPQPGAAGSTTRPAPPAVPTATPASVPTSGAPSSAQPPAARDAALFRAAGFKQTRRGWESGCDDPSAGAPYDPGAIEQMKDLNGDGRPEALITEGGSYCYGNTGTAFWLVSQQADGSWKLIFDERGIAEFLPAKGVGGWPDISVGGPGFCFPVVRWNGKAYVRNRFAYEGKPCRPGG